MLTVEQALAEVLARVTAMPPEKVALLDALGRALAEPVRATRTLPPHDNSSMDGYGVIAGDSAQPPVTLPVAFTVGAGHVPANALQPGQAARVMTGAAIPPGADAIVKREDVDESDPSRIVITRVIEKGAWIRRRGEDVTEGTEILRAGDVIGAGEVGLLAAQGRAIVTVRQRPRVAILSTGDELAEIDEQPAPGQIVNSNAWALAAQVIEAGGVPTILASARDDREQITARIREGLSADVLVTSGGVSVGDFDLVRGALESAGVTLEFWKVAMKPGKPVTFGRAPSGRAVFGLPGNPASSMVSFELFVRPALRAMLGDPAPQRPRARVVFQDHYDKDGARRHYLRAHVRRDGDQLLATLTGNQGSGMLTSMIRSNALVEIPETATRVGPGDVVTAILTGPM